MAGKQLPNFHQFLTDVLLSPYSPPARQRMDICIEAMEEITKQPVRIFPIFSTACENDACEACTGEGCDCTCHLVRKVEL